MFRSNLRSASICVAVACACAAGWAQGADAPTAAADKTFVNKAALGGVTEVKLGELACGNGQSQAVEEFGKHMVDDHTKANDELAGIARGKPTLTMHLKMVQDAMNGKPSKMS